LSPCSTWNVGGAGQARIAELRALGGEANICLVRGEQGPEDTVGVALVDGSLDVAVNNVCIVGQPGLIETTYRHYTSTVDRPGRRSA
jgi:hypothetical protein